MAHIDNIGAGMFSDMSISTDPAGIPDLDGLDDAATQLALDALFKAETDVPAVGSYSRVENVREFPAMGTPPNVVNVPIYGQATSQQIQGQADAPSMELQLNAVPADWAAGATLGDMVGDGVQRVFRFSLLNSKPEGYNSSIEVGSGLGDVQNSYYYWFGKIDAQQITPQLTDANTMTITMTIQSEFFGAYTATDAT